MQLVSVDQALLGTLIGANLGYEIAHENLPFTPTTGTPYIEPIVVINDATPFDFEVTSYITDGVFRVIIRVPLDMGAIDAKVMADTISGIFPTGQNITFNHGVFAIKSIQRNPGIAEDGWYKIILTMALSIFIRNT